jgi:hypothetical protein
LKVIPGSPHAQKDASTDPPIDEYTLQPETDGKTEILLLRINDIIYSPRIPGRLRLLWKVPQVQVHSSLTAEGGIPESEDVTAGDSSKPEEETEEEENLEQTVMDTAQPSARSTPLPSAPRTEVVQETPHGDRLKNVTDNSPGKASPSSEKGTMPEEKSTEGILADDADIFSTAPTKRHPTVKIPTKRASPDAEDVSKIVLGRRTKRAKINNDAVLEQASAAQLPVRKTAVKSKKRPSDAMLQEVPTPSKSQRSSQRSTKDEGDTYDGPPPHVAFSNSAIPESGKEAMKFLKKHGTIVESVNDDCNILW